MNIEDALELTRQSLMDGHRVELQSTQVMDDVLQFRVTITDFSHIYGHQLEDLIKFRDFYKCALLVKDNLVAFE